MNSAANSADTAAAAGIIGVFGIFYFLFIVGIIALTIWFYWRIFAKAGFNGALSLLNLIFPIGGLICILILAFGRWPIEDQLAGTQRQVPGGPAPGSNLMA